MNAEQLAGLLVELARGAERRGGPSKSGAPTYTPALMSGGELYSPMAPWTDRDGTPSPLHRALSPARGFLDPTSATLALPANEATGVEALIAPAGSNVHSVEVPAGVSVGQHFDAKLRDGRVVNVVVPPFHGNPISENRHFKAGMHFSIVVPESREGPSVRAALDVAKHAAFASSDDGSDDGDFAEDEPHASPGGGTTIAGERAARSPLIRAELLTRAVRNAMQLIVAQCVETKEAELVAVHEREMDRLNKLFLTRLRRSQTDLEHQQFLRGEAVTRQLGAERAKKRAAAARTAAEAERDEWRTKYESAEGENEDQKSYSLETWTKVRGYEEATRVAAVGCAAAVADAARLSAALEASEAALVAERARCVLLEQRAAKAHFAAAEAREEGAAAMAAAAAATAAAEAQAAKVTNECEDVIAASRIALQKALSKAAPSEDELELRAIRQRKAKEARAAAAAKAGGGSVEGGSGDGSGDGRSSSSSGGGGDASAPMNHADRERRERAEAADEAASEDSVRVLVREARLKGPEQLVAVCRAHAASLPIQLRCCREVKEMARGGSEADRERRAALAHAGAISAVVHVMRTHADSCALLCVACRALTNLAFGSDENRVEIVHSGGAGAVIAAMQRHPQMAELQARCCATLSNIAHNNDAHRIAVVQAGALAATLAAATRFQSDAAVQCAASRLLLVLAVNDAIAREALRCGAVRAITKGMRGCAEHMETQRYGCWALANIAWQHLRDERHDAASHPDSEVVRRAKEAGAAAAVRSALNRFGHDAQLVERAELALEKLSFREAVAYIPPTDVAPKGSALDQQRQLDALEHSYGRANAHGVRPSKRP